ncbi:hypothetical protein BDY24DRAFT_403587 [Mrakia frigida]|uniref:uncharacterized protein n=1 Tax=Mrakia frigida TaxID=29902 RepID=UPI003FCBF9F5
MKRNSNPRIDPRRVYPSRSRSSSFTCLRFSFLLRTLDDRSTSWKTRSRRSDGSGSVESSEKRGRSRCGRRGGILLSRTFRRSSRWLKSFHRSTEEVPWGFPRSSSTRSRSCCSSPRRRSCRRSSSRRRSTGSCTSSSSSTSGRRSASDGCSSSGSRRDSGSSDRGSLTRRRSCGSWRKGRSTGCCRGGRSLRLPRWDGDGSSSSCGIGSGRRRGNDWGSGDLGLSLSELLLESEVLLCQVRLLGLDSIESSLLSSGFASRFPLLPLDSVPNGDLDLGLPGFQVLGNDGCWCGSRRCCCRCCCCLESLLVKTVELGLSCFDGGFDGCLDLLGVGRGRDCWCWRGRWWKSGDGGLDCFLDGRLGLLGEFLLSSGELSGVSLLEFRFSSGDGVLDGEIDVDGWCRFRRGSRSSGRSDRGEFFSDLSFSSGQSFLVRRLKLSDGCLNC